MKLTAPLILLPALQLSAPAAQVSKDNPKRAAPPEKVSPRRGREQGGAPTGSIFSEVPVVTAGVVVLGDERDAEFIKSEEGQRRMAEALADGVGRLLAPAKANRQNF